MLHGEQAGLGPTGDGDLGVDVFDMIPCRLGGDHQSEADLLVRQPRATRRNTSTSRAVSPAVRHVCDRHDGRRRAGPATIAPSIRPARTS